MSDAHKSESSLSSVVRPIKAGEDIISQLASHFSRMRPSRSKPSRNMGEAPELRQDITYLRECAAILLPKIEALPKKKPYYGMIHGDVIRGNGKIAIMGLSWSSRLALP